ncbi:alkaline phosphatase family protein [Bacillus thuringiensis]|uniref:alkaline phosphatase family protein n=1 Tax=Bacillus thuringiensis TaxID=1428 RepID=UPI000E48CAF8|nr:alkaline phosphatase family protein [Bacillus thuringiensis]MDZ3952428.1 alkaline phosphatase family protein [Bacillus thuringiensis]RGP45244.1 hypothetical protein BTW32_26170 [Bacillus thuringiensis]
MGVIQTIDPWFVFLQFSNIDYAGHDSGYGPDKPAYMKAIEETDARIYRVLDALERRAARKSEEWLIIVTTDHGGIGRGHGGSSPEERTIFTVVSGEFAHRGEMIPNQNQYINQTDVMVTALNYLGVPIQENWSLDGRVVGIKTVFKDEDFACYIDPNEGPRVRITTQHSKQVETLTWSLNSSPIFGYGINNGRYTRNLAATDKGEYFQIYDHWNLNNYADVNGKYYFKFKKYYASGRMVVHEFEYNPVTGIVKYDNSTYSHGSEFSFRFFENNKQKVLITTTHSKGVYNRLLQTVTWQLNYGYGVQLGRYRYDLEVVDKGSYYEINDYWNIKNYQKINGKYYLKFINYYSNGKRTYYEYEYHPSATQIELVTEVEQSFSLPNLIDAVRDSHRFNQWKKASNIYYTNGVYFQGLFPYVLNNVEKYRVSINNNAPITKNRYNPDSNGRIEINFLEYNGGYGVAKGTLITIWAITPVGDVIKVFEDRTI